MQISSRHLLIDSETILENSIILNKIASYFEFNHPFLHIEKKFLTIAKDVLGGITIDWRSDTKQEWGINSENYKKIVKKSLYKILKKSQTNKTSNIDFNHYFQKFFIQEYSSHPLIDIYGTHISKEYTYDCVVSELSTINIDKGKIIYLGDSENDNPAFRRDDISIGINSDIRLNPNLECTYTIKYKYLSTFMKRLIINNFNFSESLLNF